MQATPRMASAVFSTIPVRRRRIRDVSTLVTGFADPDMEAMRQKVNEMILNGRRLFPNLGWHGRMITTFGRPRPCISEWRGVLL
jgi:hypothetical protein